MLKALRAILGGWFNHGARQTASTTIESKVELELTQAEDGSDHPIHSPEPDLVPYDENLLERARTQWQFGDWESLARLERDTLQHHPDRAKLALLVAAGHLQKNNLVLTKLFLRLAQDWGCGDKLISQILIAGVHNTLGRAAIAADQERRALEHFKNSITIGTPEGELRLLIRSRIFEQKRQLGVSEGSDHRESSQKLSRLQKIELPRYGAKISVASYQMLTTKFLEKTSQALQEADDRRALVDIAARIKTMASGSKLLNLNLTTLKYLNETVKFIHVAEDYIPKKIVEQSDFYEADFLKKLGELHDPGGTFLDVGANIGNHAIYFAKILESHVIAVEPVPHNAACLAINCYLNGLEERVDFVFSALGDIVGDICLKMAIEENHGSFTLSQTAEAGANTAEDMAVIVPVMRLDGLNIQRKISTIKIDVEGMELEIIRGGIELIKTWKPVITVECTSYDELKCIEEELLAIDYFPIDVVNATPTFIFISQRNPFHLRRLSTSLRESSLVRAMAKKAFH